MIGSEGVKLFVGRHSNMTLKALPAGCPAYLGDMKHEPTAKV